MEDDGAGSQGKAKHVKTLIPKERDTTELLGLIYEMFDFYSIKIGDKRGDYTAKKAWGDLIAFKFKSDLIKSITGTRKTARIEMNGGDIVEFVVFS